MQQDATQTPRTTGQRHSFGSTRDLVSLLFRRRAIFLVVFTTIFAASVVSLQSQKVVYVAEAKVLVIRGAGVTKGPEPKPYLNWWEEMKSEVVIAQSRPVAALAAKLLAQQASARQAEETVDLAGVPSEPVTPDLLIAGLTVEPIDETDVIRLTYRALNRRDSIDGVNALTRAYMEHSRQVLRDANAGEVYAEQVAAVQAEVDRLSSEIAVYKAQNDISDIQSEMIELTRQRKAVENELIDVRAGRHSTLSEIATMERSLQEHPELLLPSEEMTSDPQIATYMRQLSECESKLNTLRATYTSDNPQVQALERERQQCVGSIREQVLLFLAAKRNTMNALAGQEEAYHAELERIDQRVDELAVHESNLGRLTHQLSNARENLEAVSEQHASYKLVVELDPKFSKLRLLHDATTAVRLGGGARQQLFLVFSMVLALGLAFVAAFLVDTLDHSLKFPTDIEDALGVPVLASIREVRGALSVPERAAHESGGR